MVLPRRNIAFGGILVLRGATLRAHFTSNLVHELAFGTPKFYIASYGKIKHRLFELSSNCDMKSGFGGNNLLPDEL